MVKKLDNVKKRILLTGGHAASSAFVIIEEIRKEAKPWDVFWIGPESSFEGKKYLTLSSLYFPKYKVKTFSIVVGRIQRRWTRYTIFSILKIPIGFIHAFILILKIKPDVVLSFGGFSAFPVVLVSYFLGIPIVIHEQTSVAGRANRFSSFFARKIAISRETSKDYFPKNKIVLTGNPLPSDLIKKSSHSSLSKPKTIFVTGGQSGSSIINDNVAEILPQLLKKYKVIHQTGLKDEDKFLEIRAKLEKKYLRNYFVYGVLDPKVYNKIFNQSDILISRAGANTVSKIVYSKKPSILIPLPISYLNEQYRNAIFAEKYAGSLIINQSELTPNTLLEKVSYLSENWSAIFKSVVKFENPDKFAAKKIISLLEDYL